MATLAALGTCETPLSAQAGRNIDVRSYRARIAPDLGAQTVAGSVSIEFVAAADLSRVSFDSANLTVDSAAADGWPLRFTQADRRVTLDLGTRLTSGRSTTVTLRYHGTPKRGVTFIAQPPQVYTVFATSEWMVCIDDPSDRATLDLTIAAPPDWTVISHGNAVSNAIDESGRRAQRFLLASPAPSYTYGFAAGQFASVIRDSVGDVELRYVSTDTNENTVRRVFADTPDMLRFFENRAGAPYPGRTFTQVLTAGDAQQELKTSEAVP
jgi:aminopeptidase N